MHTHTHLHHFACIVPANWSQAGSGHSRWLAISQQVLPRSQLTNRVQDNVGKQHKATVATIIPNGNNIIFHTHSLPPPPLPTFNRRSRWLRWRRRRWAPLPPCHLADIQNKQKSAEANLNWHTNTIRCEARLRTNSLQVVGRKQRWHLQKPRWKVLHSQSTSTTSQVQRKYKKSTWAMEENRTRNGGVHSALLDAAILLLTVLATHLELQRRTVRLPSLAG